RSDKTIAVHPGAFHWTSILLDPDPEPGSWIHLYISEVPWSRGALDGVLRLVVDDQISNVTIADPDLRWLYHPYDGGMDVILPSPTERDTLRDRHSDWLSAHPRGSVTSRLQVLSGVVDIALLPTLAKLRIAHEAGPRC